MNITICGIAFGLVCSLPTVAWIVHSSPNPQSQESLPPLTVLPLKDGRAILDFNPSKKQYGVAIAPPENSQLPVSVMSPVSGQVVLVGVGENSLGNYIVIRTSIDGLMSDVTVARFSTHLIQEGSEVTAGQTIAQLQESTGTAEEPQVFIQIADADNPQSLRDPARLDAIKELEQQ